LLFEHLHRLIDPASGEKVLRSLSREGKGK